MTIKKIKTDDGVEHGIDYNALENIPTCKYAYTALLDEVEIGPDSQIELDLSDYLPNDGCSYLVSVYLTATLQKNQAAALYGVVPESEEYSRACCFSRSANYSSESNWIGNSAVVLIGPSRKFILQNTNGKGTASAVALRCVWYMRAS